MRIPNENYNGKNQNPSSQFSIKHHHLFTKEKKNHLFPEKFEKNVLFPVPFRLIITKLSTNSRQNITNVQAINQRKREERTLKPRGKSPLTGHKPLRTYRSEEETRRRTSIKRPTA